MKKQIKWFITGFMACLLVFVLACGALAASGMTISVEPIRVMVNGSEFRPTDVNGNSVMVFTYNGTTYAPLRALAEAFGLEVGYDSAAKMATVNLPSQNSPVEEPADDPAGQYVPTENQSGYNGHIYITKTGKHYHYDPNCNGGTYYESTLEEALSRGLTPCDKCVK